MANKKHLTLLKQGVEFWNQWRSEHESISPNLSGVEIGGASLRGADLSGADLSGANLEQSDLEQAQLDYTNLAGADLSGAILYRSNLRGADLSRATLNRAILGKATLIEANLSQANLSGANLYDSNLSEARVIGANLSGINLCGALLNEVDLSQATTLSGANLSKTDLSGKDLTGANLAGADLSYTVLVQTNFSQANLTGCRIYGIAAWDVKLDGANQSDIIITRPHEPDITVDNLDIAQFVYLLLHNENIRHVIDTVTSKVVLILGRFTPDRMVVLEALKHELRQRDYIPVLFNFIGSGQRDPHETVSTLAHMARFIIADITDPRGISQELGAIVPHLPSVPIQPILQPIADSEYGMFEHIKRFPWVLPVYNYKDAMEAVAEIKYKIIDPAETKAEELMPDKLSKHTNGIITLS